MPMQPRPISETSGPTGPRVRVSMARFLSVGVVSPTTRAALLEPALAPEERGPDPQRGAEPCSPAPGIPAHMHGQALRAGARGPRGPAAGNARGLRGPRAGNAQGLRAGGRE